MSAPDSWSSTVLREQLSDLDRRALLATCICRQCVHTRSCICGRLLRVDDDCPACGRPAWCAT